MKIVELRQKFEELKRLEELKAEITKFQNEIVKKVYTYFDRLEQMPSDLFVDFSFVDDTSVILLLEDKRYRLSDDFIDASDDVVVLLGIAAQDKEFMTEFQTKRAQAVNISNALASAQMATEHLHRLGQQLNDIGDQDVVVVSTESAGLVRAEEKLREMWGVASKSAKDLLPHIAVLDFDFENAG